MNFTATPPAGWDERIAFPLQSVGFARASHALGHRPLFVEDDRGIAWGVSGAPPTDRGGPQRVIYHVFVNNLRGGGADVLAKASKAVRRDIRKALAQVTVAEVRTAADLRDSISLTAQTGLRASRISEAVVGHVPAPAVEVAVREKGL